MISTSGSPEMLLVGGMQVRDAQWDMEWFAGMYGRLADEVKHTGRLTRYVAYEGFADERCEVRFLGIEVEQIGDIPRGMVSWEVRGDTLTVRENNDLGNAVVWQQKVDWQWLNIPPSGRATGEFSVLCPSDWVSGGTPARLDFRMMAVSYLSPDRNGCDDGIYLVHYDLSWPARYEEIACRLRDGLGPGLALRIEHYGSTSIPGTPAKPIIDVLVEVPSFAEARKHAIPLLSGPECEYWWYTDHVCFIMRAEFMGVRTHHIHMATPGHRIWEGLAFRDYMRTHPEDAARYAALKYELAARYRTDREGYTNAKTDFVRRIITKLDGWQTGEVRR